MQSIPNSGWMSQNFVIDAVNSPEMYAMSTQGKWDATAIPDQMGRVAVVTGANSGIGFETAKELAKKGAVVVLACRNQSKGEAAANAIRSEKPAGRVQVMALDLSSLASVRAFAAEFSSEFERLDLLINNAGVMALPKRFETLGDFRKRIYQAMRV